MNEDADHVGRLLDGRRAGRTRRTLVRREVITDLADHPKMRHAAYLTAVWPHREQSVMDLYGGVLPRPITPRGDGSRAHMLMLYRADEVVDALARVSIC